jgi:hypothetical protein
MRWRVAAGDLAAVIAHLIYRRAGSRCVNADLRVVVIARGALATKQSILPLRGKMDCFAALAMTAEGVRATLSLVVARLDRVTQYSRGA